MSDIIPQLIELEQKMYTGRLEKYKSLLSWSLFFSTDNEVQSISLVYNKYLDEGNGEAFIYSLKDVDKLEQLRKEYLPPLFNSNQFIAQEQLREYSKMLKAKLK